MASITVLPLFSDFHPITYWFTIVTHCRNAYFIDSMSNHEVVKLHANEPHEMARFNDYLSKIQGTALANTQSLAWLNLGQSLVFSCGLTVMMLMSAYQVNAPPHSK